MSKRSLVIALSAIALGVVTTVPASADAAGNDIIEIKSVQAGTCMSVVGDSAWPAPCDGTTKQRWERAKAADGRFILRSVGDGRCVIGWSGTALWHCDVENSTNLVEFVPTTADSIKMKFDAGYATIAAGGAIIKLQSEDDTDEQRWLVTKVGETTPPADTTGQVIQLKSHPVQRCATPSNDRLMHAPCTGAAEQRFQRVELGDGWFQLRNDATGTCVSATTYFAEARPCAADDKQKWRLDHDVLGLARISTTNGWALSTALFGESVYVDPPTMAHKFTFKWEISAVA